MAAYSLPENLKAIRLTVARSQSRRVTLLVVGVFGLLFLVLCIARSRATLFALLAMVICAEIGGIVYVMRLGKAQSIALGFACPLCGGALYDGNTNRLGNRGECPCCKRFVIDQLDESGA